MQQKLKMLSGVVMVSAFIATSAQARSFRAADIQPLDYPTVMGIKHISEVLSNKTGKKYDIRLYANAKVGDEKETVEQVRNGALDMARLSIAAFHNSVPDSMVPSLPFLFRDMDHFRKTMYGPQGDKLIASFDKTPYVVLALWESGTRSFYAKKPIKSLADIKGLKVRVQQSELMSSVVTTMGATPVPVSLADIHDAFKSGQIDAAENNYSSYSAHKHYELAPVYSETQHMMTPDVLVFSRKVWDTLTKEEQDNILSSVKESRQYYVDLWTKKEAESKAVAQKGGATFVGGVNRAEFVTAMKPVWDKYAASPKAKALVQEIVNAK